jgi:uncharacterized coiled-coil DUF342 family protein
MSGLWVTKMTMTKELEQEIRNCGTANDFIKHKNILLQELDALRSERDELSKMNSDGCGLLAKAIEERDAWRELAMKQREMVLHLSKTANFEDEDDDEMLDQIANLPLPGSDE